MLARFNPVGFIVGLVLAIILVVGLEALLPPFNRDVLVYGLLGVLLWAYCTFNWPWAA